MKVTNTSYFVVFWSNIFCFEDFWLLVLNLKIHIHIQIPWTWPAGYFASDTVQWGTVHTVQPVPTLPEASGGRGQSTQCSLSQHPNADLALSLLLKGSLFLLTVVLCLVVCLWLRAHCPGAAAALPLDVGVILVMVENGVSCLQADCLPWLPFIPSPVGSF